VRRGKAESRAAEAKGPAPSAPVAIRALLLALTLACLPAAAQPGPAPPPHAVVLLYHRFGEDRHPSTNVDLGLFEAHLELLEREGFQVWPLGRILEALAGGEPLPDKVVAITVDDAYRSVATEAFPRLRSRGWPFTVFVATDGVDRGYRALMDWETMRRLAREGVRFANHSASHGHLVRRRPGEDEGAWRARVRADILRAQRRLEEELGEAQGPPPAVFAYPYGEYDAALAEVVAELGLAAFGQQSGPVGPWSDRRALPRFPLAGRFAALEAFRTKVLSLPLPVRAVEPWDPVTAEARPALVLTLEEEAATRHGVRLEGLRCYASGQGAIPVRWLGRRPLRLEARARDPLPTGRSRYNCTAPSPWSGRWFWFSHPWLRPAPRPAGP